MGKSPQPQKKEQTMEHKFSNTKEAAERQKKQTDNELAELRAFMAGPDFKDRKKVSHRAGTFLVSQDATMQNYVRILDMRIALFDEEAAAKAAADKATEDKA